MERTARHDAWTSGESYEAYMGRWSRAVAPLFLDWLGAERGRDWLDVGCGTGALTAAILARCDPAGIVSLDRSESFVAAAKAAIDDPRVAFATADAEALGLPDASRDVAVSALVLNFVADRARALTEARRVVRPGGLVGFYVWDYPGRGLEFLSAFWNAAAALDPAARDLGEAARFPFCTPDGLQALAARAGLARSEVTAITVPTTFREFDDYWRPFTLGAGPAPGYCASLSPEDRERLRDRLHDALPRESDGSIAMRARAWALRARVP